MSNHLVYRNSLTDGQTNRQTDNGDLVLTNYRIRFRYPLDAELQKKIFYKYSITDNESKRKINRKIILNVRLFILDFLTKSYIVSNKAIIKLEQLH